VKLLKGKRLAPVMRSGNQSIKVESCGSLDRKASFCCIFALMDALFCMQVNISFVCRTKPQGNVAALAVL
jgi:hypothetical protein